MRPLIIGHRGASGYRPEHTLEGYALAIEQGADAIEPDLIFTRDGQLVCRHDLGLSRSTDVALRPEFAHLWRGLEKAQDDDSERASGDWFVSDFTYAELSQLRAIQPWPSRGTEFDRRLRIPLYSELLELARQESLRRGREIQVYTEIKHPGHFRELGHDFTSALLEVLGSFGYLTRIAPVLILSFEHNLLEEIKQRSELRTNALLAQSDSFDLSALSAFSDGIGFDKRLLIDGNGADTGICARAQALGLDVNAWTLRDDQPYAPFAPPYDEYSAYFKIGVDALFCDFPASALAARKAWLAVRDGVPAAVG